MSKNEGSTESCLLPDYTTWPHPYCCPYGIPCPPRHRAFRCLHGFACLLQGFPDDHLSCGRAPKGPGALALPFIDAVRIRRLSFVQFFRSTSGNFVRCLLSCSPYGIRLISLSVKPSVHTSLSHKSSPFCLFFQCRNHIDHALTLLREPASCGYLATKWVVIWQVFRLVFKPVVKSCSFVAFTGLVVPTRNCTL